MAQTKKKWPVIAGVIFIAGFIAAMVWSTSTTAQFHCEVASRSTEEPYAAMEPLPQSTKRSASRPILHVPIWEPVDFRTARMSNPSV